MLGLPVSSVVALIALAATFLVGLDLALRPARHVRASADRVSSGRGVPLEAISHRFLPQFETPGAYRAIGLAIMGAAVVLGWMFLG